MLSLTVKKVDVFKFDGVAESDNTDTKLNQGELDWTSYLRSMQLICQLRSYIRQQNLSYLRVKLTSVHPTQTNDTVYRLSSWYDKRFWGDV